MKVSISYPTNPVQAASVISRYETITFSIDGEGSPTTGITGTVTINDPNGITVAVLAVTATTPATWVPTTIGKYDYGWSLSNGVISNAFLTVGNHIIISNLSCNQFKITNASTTITITESYEAISGSVTPDTTHTLLPQQSAAISLPTADLNGNAFVGIFKFNLAYTYNTVIYSEYQPVSTYCIIDDCIASYILDILCGPVDRCLPCPDSLQLNRMMMLSQAYFMGANNLFSFNNFYNNLDSSTLSDLQNLDNTMKKLLTYCNRKTCIDNQYLTEAKWHIVDYDYQCPDCYSSPKTYGCTTCN